MLLASAPFWCYLQNFAFSPRFGHTVLGDETDDLLKFVGLTQLHKYNLLISLELLDKIVSFARLALFTFATHYGSNI